MPTYFNSKEVRSSIGRGWTCVCLDPSGTDVATLQECLSGNWVGNGGKDAKGSLPYTTLELRHAWRVENRFLWGKFAAEKQQVTVAMGSLSQQSLMATVAFPVRFKLLY